MSPRILEQSPGHYRLQYSLPPDLAPQHLHTWLETALDDFLEQEQRELWDLPRIESQTPDTVVVLTRVYPPVQLPALNQLSLKLPPLQEPNQDLLQSHLIALQQRLAQADPLQGPAQAGDRVAFSYYLASEGQAVPGTAQGHLTALLRDDLIGPGFYTHLLGQSVGAELRVPWQIEKTPHAPPGHTGPAEIVLQIHQLERLSLPPLDESFPALSGLGGLDQNWQTFFLNLHERLQNEYEQQWRGFVRRALLYLLAEEAVIDMPADLFAAQQLNQWQATEGQALKAFGLSEAQQASAFEAWSQDPRFYESGYADLKASLALRELIKRAKITLSSDELGSLLQPYAEALGQPIEAVHAALTQTGALQTLLDQALSEKAIDLLLSQAQLIPPEPTVL